jgi:hypothetical protein
MNLTVCNFVIIVNYLCDCGNNRPSSKCDRRKSSGGCVTARRGSSKTKISGIVDLSRRVMRKLARDRNGDARQQAGSSMRQPQQQRERSRASDVETGRAVAAAGDDERNELLLSGDTGDRLTALTSGQMTAIAETDESEVDELFSPDTAYSSVLSPSNTHMLSNSASDSNLNSTLTAARINNSNKNQLDVKRDSVNVVLRKMLQTRPVSLLRPHSCSDAATQVMASDIMSDNSTCVLLGTGIRVSAKHQMDGSRRNSFDPRLMRRTSSRKLSSDSCSALNLNSACRSGPEVTVTQPRCGRLNAASPSPTRTMTLCLTGRLPTSPSGRLCRLATLCPPPAHTSRPTHRSMTSLR